MKQIKEYKKLLILYKQPTKGFNQTFRIKVLQFYLSV
jgi:hypothetical protein